LPKLRNAPPKRGANQLDEAVALYREGLRLRPSWKEGIWYLGTSLFGLSRYAEARDVFLHLALSQSANGSAWALAGMSEFELKNFPRALEYLSRADGIGIAENQELASLVRFRIALLLNRTGESEQAINRLIPIAVVGTYPEVIEAMGLSVLRAPLLPSQVPEQDRDLYMRAGEAMNAFVAHDSDGAARLFEELVNNYPDRPNVHYARGRFLLETAPDQALLEFQRELDRNPSHLIALVEVARLYLKQGNAEKALPYARRAVKTDLSLPAPHRLLGESLLESGQTSTAIEELETAVHLEPEFPQTHFLLAHAYKRVGNSALARTELAEFQRLDRKQKHEQNNVNAK
jgi:tetratricopeptide (TPR) repeat protein